MDQGKQEPLEVVHKINLKIKEMFKKHIHIVQKLNQGKDIDGNNLKNDKNDKFYRELVQLQAKIKEGIFKNLKESQTLRKQRKEYFQNKMGRFAEILKQLIERKNRKIKIKINDNLEKIVVEASNAAQEAVKIIKRFQKQGTGWCGKTSDFKVPLEKALIMLCEYGFLFQNLSKFESVTNDSVKEIYLPVEYKEQEFSFLKKDMVELWPKPVVERVEIPREVIKEVIVKEETKVNSQVSRIDEAHELYFGWTRPQEPYKAIKIYEEEAKKSISKLSALNALGAIYEAGKYVPKDLRKALKFYKEAEKLNSSEAMHRIGLFLEKGLINSKQEFQGKYPNREAEIRAAIQYYEKAAKLGHLDSMTDLGFIYENGIKNEFNEFIIEPYPQPAVEYYKKARKQDFPRALNNLGSFLIKNDKFMSTSRNQNMEKGIKYLQRAKDLKYPKAFLNLGKCYENGIGISLSIDMARACYLEGIQAGEISCKMEYIRTFLTEKLDDSKLMIKLAELCRQILLKDQSNPQANYFMGLFCQKGIGAEKNKESSFYYIEKAARRNHPAALVKLGDYYYSGYFAQKNYEYAKKLYDMARQKGNTQAMLNIGLMREKGLVDDGSEIYQDKVFEGAAKMGNANGILYSGLNKGPQEEREALIKAAEMGSIQAVDILKKSLGTWIPKKHKQNIVTHSEWMQKHKNLTQGPVQISNISNRPSSRVSSSKKYG